MAKTHYETLGLKRSATAAEIKSAYRKIVLAHHPDRSKDPRSVQIFMSATEAYDVLTDASAKLRYDEGLNAEAKRIAERQRQATATQQKVAAPSGPRPGWTETVTSPSTVAADVSRLPGLFARGKHAEAESLAREILAVSPRQPVCYAILGDIHRARGNVNEAARMYAYAAQFEPNNPVYQRRYEELLSSNKVVETRHHHSQLQGEDRKGLAPLVGGGLILLAAIFLAISPEKAVFGKVAGISSWTGSLPIVLFLAGVSVGATLAIGNLLDRFQSLTTTATGRIGPAVALALVAVVNFWAALLLYLSMGAFQNAFNYSTTRIMAGVVVATVTLAFASSAHVVAAQALTWGGNLVYLGALIGWLVADQMKG
ncbi:J domain-containing protein [Fimbriimonas ginsengisoli]|uniref:Chaperone protein DnaJ n=1 Tax=Fimbriimonas ginsengisoli Gsoil 348 TaxID=661478 RepID=A0A068NPX4_FIMGI|nr:J domain-containing protein [Fimbriimonas ginsengisoli]AIE85583.1 Chaperone protein DnaJ [Fimbriimonas ginsengisoli Gsoil 348]